MAQLDKDAVKAGLKNTKQVRKQMRKNAHRNGYVAAARFALSVLAFAWILLSGVLEARDLGTSPEGALLPATIAFFVVWFILGFPERAISKAIAIQILETRRIEREAAAELDRELQRVATEEALARRAAEEEAAAARRVKDAAERAAMFGD
jgi:hypothetical protein